MLPLPLILGISVISLLFLNYLWSRRKLYLFAAQVPGPFGFPVVGNGLRFLWKGEEEILNALVDAISEYPSPMRLWMGPKLVVCVRDPNQLQVILQSSKITTKGFVYKFFEPFLGQGLFTASGPYHKSQRRMLQPLFSQKMIDGYSYLFQKHANKFIEQIKIHENGPEFDILDYLNHFAFESTMDLLLEDKNDHSIDYKDIPQFVRRFYAIVFTRARKFWLHFDFIYKMSSFYKQQMGMKQVATTLINEIMDTRVPEIHYKLKNNLKTSDELRAPSMLESMTEMVLENPDCLTVEESTDHLMTFVATSQDTQSSAIAFTCMMLGAYPHIQDLVYKELKEVLGSRTSLDLTDASQLKYLEMCLKESMRLYPVAPFIFRETTEDFQLEKLTIPQGVTVTVAIFHVHRDPKLWERPYEYYPEHFSPEATSKRHPYAYIPFSAGPRKCIAQQYSFANMKIVIGSILLNYELECLRKVEDIKLKADISIRPIGGYKIKIKKRV